MKALFFDTSFIFKQGKKAASFLPKLREEGHAFFVPELVIQETKAKNRRAIRDHLMTIEKAASQEEIRKYFPEICAPKEEKCRQAYEKSDANIEKFFKEFGETLPLPAPSDAFKLILARDQEKKPPFADGESDKGWKDTLIWVSILEFSRTNDFEEYIFVTKDRYDRGTEAMQKEFKEVTGKDITFLEPSDFQDLMRKLGLGVSKQNDDVVELMEDALLSKEEVERCKKAIRSFVYWEDESGYIRPFFRPDGYISGDKVREFCDYLLTVKNDFLFADYIDIGECFAAVSIRGRLERWMWAEDFNAFIDCWETLSICHPDYRDVFARQVARELNDG